MPYWKSIFRVFASFTLLLSMVGALAGPGLAGYLENDQLRVELVVYAPSGIQTGQTFWLGLKFNHKEHWHTYWKNPGDSGLATQLDWQLPKGLLALDTLWPTPQKIYVSNFTNYGYEGSALLVTPIRVGESYNASIQNLTKNPWLDIVLHANWLVCKNECIPQSADLGLQIPTKGSSAMEALLFESVLAQQPIPLSTDQQVLEIQGQTLVGKIKHLPKEALNRPYSFFPEIGEVIADPELDQTKKQPISPDISLFMHPMRETKPRQVPILLNVQTSKGIRNYVVNFRVQGIWPNTASQTGNDFSNPHTLETNQRSLAETLPLKQNFSFALAILGAFFGGLLLNLMPCVLPVLAIKALSLLTHTSDIKRHRKNAWGYTLGVVVCFLVLGLCTVLLKAILGHELGWGFQLQSPYAVAFLCVIFTLIALNLLDLLQVGVVVPNWLANLHSQDPLTEGIFSGILSVVVAAPCTAPFMGASLGWALSAPTWQGLGVFLFLGLGLSFPLLIISWTPSLARLLPKPGAWMNTLRHWLALPIFASIIWLLWVLMLQIGINLTLIFSASLLLIIGYAYWLSDRKSHLILVSALFGSLILCTGYLGFQLPLGQADRSINLPTTDLAKVIAEEKSSLGSAFLSPRQGSENNLTHTSLAWETWSPQAVQSALDKGQNVFIDFTAAWCITCQVNERTTLQNSDIKASLLAKNVRLFKADWTRPDDRIAKTLVSLGRSGIPVYVLQGPNKPQILLTELLSVSELKLALESF